MRMFVALFPPEDALEDLAEFLVPRQEADPGFRWTVRSSGTSRSRSWATSRTARSTTSSNGWPGPPPGVPPSRSPLAGGGAFPDPARAKVLFAGVETSEAGQELPRLATGARAAATKAGCEADGGRFHPHVTLARIGRPVRPPAGCGCSTPTGARPGRPTR